MDQEKRFRDIKRILLIILVLNWGVALAKIFYGYVTNFTSMKADGFHSLADGASNIIGLIGITLARRPPDKDHPYGHKKYETLFALAIAGMLFFVCFNLFTEGIKRLHSHSVPQIDAISMIVMLITMSVNILVMTYEYRAGKRLNSDILVSDSLHTKADIFTSASVIIAMIVIKLGYPILDPIVTIMIAFFIAYAGYSIARDSSKVLCDEIVISDDNKIKDVVMTVNGVKACHKIRTRGRADDIHVDLHVQVNPDMHVDKAHDISYRIEGAIKSYISGVTDVVVHIEPKK
ncbi:MAG: cation diffusion facilitator family transporter [Candidatus Omnitrophica bacterium]|nr:cation diffusion facilitator family transporter [Candidatus Omnitrophota bacterium]